MSNCDGCSHGTHYGGCGEMVQVQGVETDCGCFRTHGATRDIRGLRQGDAAQQRALTALARRGGLPEPAYKPGAPLGPTAPGWEYKLPWEE